MKIARASILSCFDAVTVGTKVVDADAFMAAVETAVANVDFTKTGTPGQSFIPLPGEALSTVSCGVGLRTDNPADYALLNYRGVVTPFLLREHALQAERLAVSVYTKEAYLNDPEVKENADEVARIEADEEITHVLIAVIASAGPESPRSPERLVAAMSGENREFEFILNGANPGGGENRAKVDTSWINQVRGIPAMCEESILYHRKYCVVADPVSK